MLSYTAKIKVGLLFSSLIPVHLQQETFEPVVFLSNKLPNFDVMHLIVSLLDTVSVSLPDCTSDSSANTLPM